MAIVPNETGYRLRATHKTRARKDHPDRNRQFHYLNETAIAFSMRKELVGNYKNPGASGKRRVKPTTVAARRPNSAATSSLRRPARHPRISFPVARGVWHRSAEQLPKMGLL